MDITRLVFLGDALKVQESNYLVMGAFPFPEARSVFTAPQTPKHRLNVLFQGIKFRAFLVDCNPDVRFGHLPACYLRLFESESVLFQSVRLVYVPSDSLEDFFAVAFASSLVKKSFSKKEEFPH